MRKPLFLHRAGNESGMKGGIDREIDRALRVVGGVEPRPGFEARLLAGLSHGGAAAERQGAISPRRWAPAFGGARGGISSKFGGSFGSRLRVGLAAAVAGVAILAGGLIHTHSSRPIIAVPVLQAPLAGRGFGAAGAGRLPDQAIQTAGTHSAGTLNAGRGSRSIGRPRHGRAVLPEAPARRADGAAAPSSPYPGDDSALPK